MQPYANELINYPFSIRCQRSHKKGETGIKRILCEDIFTFDIETTSFFYESDKKPFLYKPGYDPEYWSDVYAGAVCYIWQFGINDRYYYGRELDDFYKLLSDFPEEMHVKIFVHNLSFEWHFLDRLHWVKVFAKNTHKPIRAVCSEFPNIEFQCTLSLENRSLDSWGKALGVPKLTGTVDYNVMRTPLTELEPELMAYAERDLKVMYEGLKQELKEYNSVHNLPLTSTGKVRRVVKDKLMNDNKYVNYIHALVPDVYNYKTSIFCYSGGYCHANRVYVGQTLYNKDGKHGGHYDYTSSYPFELVTQKFVSTTWSRWKNGIPDDSLFEDHAFKMHLVFYKIRSELRNTYIQYSHTDSVNPTCDNGRLMSADICDLWITEQDYSVIKRAYTWERVEIVEIWEAYKTYLPLPFVEYILELFNNKTVYRGIESKKDEYSLAKSRLNALYGMICTRLCQSEITWNDETGEWSVGHLTTEKIQEHFEKLKMYRDKRYFLNFDAGVWCSNGSRCRLWNDLIIPYDKYVIYADTDSIFTTISIDFTDYNNMLNERVEKVCKERGLDVEKTRPIGPDGKRSYLGNLTSEQTWRTFKTLGSKRYLERWASDGQLHLTVAGINKEAVSCLNDNEENFRNGVVFDKDEKDVNKLLHTYIDNMPDIEFPDGYISHQRRGVNLRPNGYRLTTDPTFDEILKNIGTYHLDAYENHLRGCWYDDIDELIDYAHAQIAGKGKE